MFVNGRDEGGMVSTMASDVEDAPSVEH